MMAGQTHRLSPVYGVDCTRIATPVKRWRHLSRHSPQRLALNLRGLRLRARLQQAAVENRNIFDVLMDGVRVCSLGQITAALFEVGGQYRRNM